MRLDVILHRADLGLARDPVRLPAAERDERLKGFLTTAVVKQPAGAVWDEVDQRDDHDRPRDLKQAGPDPCAVRGRFVVDSVHARSEQSAGRLEQLQRRDYHPPQRGGGDLGLVSASNHLDLNGQQRFSQSGIGDWVKWRPWDSVPDQSLRRAESERRTAAPPSEQLLG